MSRERRTLCRGSSANFPRLIKARSLAGFNLPLDIAEMDLPKTVRRSAEGETDLGSVTSQIRAIPAPVTIAATTTSNTSSTTAPEPAARGTYFRFLDLPPELRNRTYSFAFSYDRTQARSLADLKFPGITQANEQLRQECLASLFVESSFFLYVGSHLRVWEYVRKDLKPLNLLDKE
ncbi:hypothetical protein CLAFUW4_04406 [Fulvia fulva]|uniref:Uncharacterized protein n=1 Tax=Passalora fulva TaxID=5499 RepID=A0A9Q8P7W3_PASFU|nr:uncharacterized protein CLAFUR5_04369 [Fulvia fulva]KAK4627078.1 hypothetical protein CLAFUR4_04392 [Fulvia fulva]KAK4627832.1 hypothetical protein CLAFUR0_04394 [Fulvia fulva]UJO16456.1 hypothetical protein CLAFUR5_04369 [Fulvia fulva]WPV13588.1 hypothetical protein CLAFUW4_04406 [Fulvia fulva]WPV28811.1 hypothetical protein CLAFUW7_04396 [Fulvia fulva]